MLGQLIGGILSGVGLATGKTLFDKFAKKNNSSITPAIPVAIEKNDRYQKLLQQYVIQQEKRETELKQLVFASTKMQGQMILQEEKWKELTYQQQQQLIDNAAQHNQRIVELKAQELEQVRELEQLKLSLMEQWHREKFSQQNRQILQQWDLSNWNSKLNREETEDLLQPKEFKHRLLTLISRPKIVGNSLFCPDVLHEQIKSTLFDLNEHVPRSELEVYCDYFKSPIEDTDIPRLQKILNSIPTLILSTKIIRNRIYFSGVFWGMGDEESTTIQLPAWDMSAIFKELDNQEEAILKTEEIIAYVQKILIIYIKDLYFLSFDFHYRPTILSNNFQNVFSENIDDIHNILAEPLMEAHAQQVKQLKSLQDKVQAEWKKKEILEKKALTSKHAAYYFNRGNSWFQIGKYEESIKDFSEAIRLSPNNTGLYNSLGNTYYALRKYDKAIQEFSQAIKLDSNSAILYRNRGESWSKLSNHKKATEDFSEAIKLAPNDSGLYNLRGIAYYYLGKYGEALQDFENALRLDPQNPKYLENRNNAKKFS